MLRFFKRWGRWILLGFGLSAVGGLIFHVGPGRVWQTLVTAAPFLPVILAFEAGWLAIESCALLGFYGAHARRVPLRVFLRTMMVHYLTIMILPVGRAGAEVTRATMLAPYVGGQRATAGAVQIQSMVWLANAMISIACLMAILPVTGWRGLALLTVGNTVATGLMGVALYLFIRRVHVGKWLGKRFRKMANWGPELDKIVRQGPRTPLVPLFFCFAGRVMQVVQYGFLLAAVGGTLSVSGALIAEGIHLVGAGLGDIIPNQVGVTEGAYRLFADALGVGDEPEKALGIALLARIANLSIAMLCFIGSQLLNLKRPR